MARIRWYSPLWRSGPNEVGKMELIMVIPKCVVCITLDIYVFITITGSIPLCCWTISSIWVRTKQHLWWCYQKYVLCMCNRKLCNIRPSWGLLTGSDVTGSGPARKYVLRMPGFFPCFFLSSSTKCWLGCSLWRSRPITIGNWAFWPEDTSVTWWTWPEVCSAHARFFPVLFS